MDIISQDQCLIGMKTSLIVGKSKKRSDSIINLHKKLNNLQENNICYVNNLNDLNLNSETYIFDKHLDSGVYRNNYINDIILHSNENKYSVIISVNEISDVPSIIRHLVDIIIFTDVIIDKETYLIYYDKIFKSYDNFLLYINTNLEFSQCLIFINSNNKQKSLNIFQLNEK